MGKKAKRSNKHQTKKNKALDGERLPKETEIESSIHQDDRFDISKPQFRQRQTEASKVVLDERFASVLSDPRFQLDVQDKYGRRQKKKQAKEELSAFYTVQAPDADDAGGSDGKKKPVVHKKPVDQEAGHDDGSSASSSNDDHDEEKEIDQDPSSRIAFLTALSRGELDVSSSDDDDDDDDADDDADDVHKNSNENQMSSDDDDDSDNDKDNKEAVHETIGILDPSTREHEIQRTEEESPYLAVMNMDWTHVRAVDIFAIISSFTPPGAVKRVCVYPSDFGLERIAKEDQFGPTGLWKETKVRGKDSGDGNDEDDDDDKGKTVKQANDEGDSDGDESSDDDDAAQEQEYVQSGFDPEKLRAYEASKLKYYFAVVEFTHPQHADKAYKEIDGMEFEHSSAAVDMRSIPPQDVQGVVQDRPLRDEATSLPSNYVPPEFIVAALQQTTVQCSWELGDRERERTLTKYSSSGLAWGSIAENDDLQAYLASDVSSDEEEDEKGNERGAKLRKMLGLDSDDDDDDENDKDAGMENRSGSDSESEQEDENDQTRDQCKEFTFVPGKDNLKNKIRSKLENKHAKEELTPWEAYQEKRKQKQKERRQAARAKKKEFDEIRTNSGSKPKSHEARPEKDSFFEDDHVESDEEDRKPTKQSQAELELLMAGDNEDEARRDFDMRGLRRIDKNKDKKMRGSRKRKETNLAANVTGTEFKVNFADERFKAVLDGQDDRFGIDRTDPNYKETPAMREILTEQTERRKKKRQKMSNAEEKESSLQVRKDISADVAEKNSKPTGGAAALSALVKSLKSKVQQ